MGSTVTAWEGQLIERIAAEIRRLRTAQKMSAQALADRVTALGLAVSRSTVADIENGRRKFITVAELLAIANALNAAPIMLMFPGPYTDFELVDLPGSPAGNPIGRGHKTEAIKWCCGESLNERLISDFNAYEENRRPLEDVRELAQLERDRFTYERAIRSFLEKGDDDQVELHSQLLLEVNRKIEQARAK